MFLLVVAEDPARGLELLVGEPQRGLHAVEDAAATRVDRPPLDPDRRGSVEEERLP